MALILALDTAAKVVGVALVEGGEVLAEVTLTAAMPHDAGLFPAIETALASGARRLEELDAIAVAAGPGSFTGLRTGIAVVKGLGEALGRPVFGISTLAALALAGSGGIRAAVMDARRGMVYVGCYTAAGDPAGGESILAPGDWEASIGAVPDTVVIREESAAKLLAAVLPGVEFQVVAEPLAGAVGQLAERAWHSGERPDPAALDAR